MEKVRIEKLLKDIERNKQLYERTLRKTERKRKRERDTFLTEKDRTILIESFAIGGILENLIIRALNRIF
ncbi:hypothetical protein [Thermocrinis sp.]|uniref:hypothetical protein n=1 Tax=Thermocrinis sp. TaxID=2024383 RepID=UPI002FDD2220